MPVLPKKERLRMFLERLEAAPSANSADEALDLLAKALTAVEDEFSGTPNRPERWRTDGRLYPPQEDSRVKYPERPSLRKYRTKGNYIFVGLNGSISIETLEGEVLLDKSGRARRKERDPDA